MKTHLYRHFDASGRLLYVGVSINPFNRLHQHKHHSRWYDSVSRVEMEQHDSREKAIAAERKAILAEQPEYNIIHRRKKPKDLTKRDLSGLDVINRTVRVKPLYTVAAAAQYLDVLKRDVQFAIDSKDLGTVLVPYKWRGERRHRVRITGWQILDYLEYLESREAA